MKIKEQYLNEIVPEEGTGISDAAYDYGLGGDTSTDAVPSQYLSEITFLNKKLFALHRIISNPDDMQLFENDPVKVNMSGSGMRFESDGSFKVGDLLDLKMVLPTAPFSIIKAIGLVLRMDKLPKNSSLTEPSYDVAVKFLVVNEDNRESVIKCVFSWQRKMLRRFKITHSA